MTTHNPTVLTREALAEIRARERANKMVGAMADRAALLAHIDALESLPPVEPTEAMVEAAFREWWRNDCRFGMTEAEAVSTFKTALSLAKPQEHNGSEGNG